MSGNVKIDYVREGDTSKATLHCTEGRGRSNAVLLLTVVFRLLTSCRN